ncbi:hypothetical protein ACWDE0_22290 [Streptomyces sp. 900105755]
MPVALVTTVMTAPVLSWPDRRDTAGARTGPATEQGQEVVRT